MSKAFCKYCQSDTECRGSAWSTDGRDLEAFERLHSRANRRSIKAARQAKKEETR